MSVAPKLEHVQRTGSFTSPRRAQAQCGRRPTASSVDLQARRQLNTRAPLQLSLMGPLEDTRRLHGNLLQLGHPAGPGHAAVTIS
jgi:hypothetical protein